MTIKLITTFLVLFILSVVLVLSENFAISATCHNDAWSGQNFMKNVAHQCTCEPYNADDMKEKKSLIFFEVYGRLANRMLGYAIQLSIKREYGFRTFLSSHVLYNLQYYFEKVDQVQPIEQLCFDQYNWLPYLMSPRLLVNDDNMGKGKAIDYVNGARLMGNNINGKLYWSFIMANHTEEIRNSLKLKQTFVNDADVIIEDVVKTFSTSSTYVKKNGVKKRNVFVGIHLRKTDAIKGIIEKYRLPELKNSYYIAAMDVCAQKYSKKKFNLLFFAISDDVDWVKTYFVPRVKDKFNIFVAGTGAPEDPHSIGVDLAIMSRMNHTILSYGTFSFWSGFLSRGPRIIPSQILHPRGRGLNPLDADLHVFSQPDEGLVYGTIAEKLEMGVSGSRIF